MAPRQSRRFLRSENFSFPPTANFSFPALPIQHTLGAFGNFHIDRNFHFGTEKLPLN